MEAPDRMTAVQGGTVGAIRWAICRAPAMGGNGYVKLPPDHPWHGKDYDDIRVSIHGGLTYAHSKGDKWWIGFDTAHAGDYWSKTETNKLGPAIGTSGYYSFGSDYADIHWTVTMLVKETRDLAARANRAYKRSKSK